MRPLKNVQFCSKPRKAKILTTDHTNKAYNQHKSIRFGGADTLPSELLFNPQDMKAEILKKHSNNQNTPGEIISFRDILDSGNRKAEDKSPVNFSRIIGKERKMIEVFRQIINVAEYDYPVNIFGETGTGKELVAEAIHKASPRKDRPFVPINCGAMPEGLVESELFGHVKGSFSGAIRHKKGRFELADGGTIFLDEIAELSKHMQAKLLRFLQDGKFEKVGGEKTVGINVRIISATNKNLKEEMKKNRFRDDLYYRINVVPISLPPLRERKSDIPLLVNHFLKQAARQYNRNSVVVSNRAMMLLTEYKWSGNVRELQNAIQFAFVKSRDGNITPDNLPMEINDNRLSQIIRGPSRKLDRAQVESAIKKTGGNKAKAARLLNVGRATLYRFINDYPDLQESICAYGD
ncbi:MAG: sigma-54-dependent Fis family transcriptional regulator [Deltaproteobacteria bacterium]|nr:sigma-54-dependent Fis family transcriptional regulator [Deltaproteobacteria bacterium]